MGYYVPNRIPIELLHTVREVKKVTDLSIVPEELALIVEVDNNAFKAYALAYDQDQLDLFNMPDYRRKKFYVMDKAMAHRLAEYKQ